MPKTCDTCKWMVDPGKYPKCHAPSNFESRKIEAAKLVSPLVADTDDKYRYEYCTTQRMGGWFDSRLVKTCGRSGRWWESAP